MKRMQDNFIDLVVTSPPYDDMREYNGCSQFNFKEIADQLFRKLKTGGVVVWIVGDKTTNGDESGTSFQQALYFKKIGFRLFDTMIYQKPPRGAVGNNQTYWQSFEYMFVLSKGKPKTINLIRDRTNLDSRKGDNGTKRLANGGLLKVSRGGYGKVGRRTNVWTYNVGKGHSASDPIAHKHLAIFPEKLAEDHIVSWSNKGDLVFDPFCGSGTTPLMALLSKRNYIGSEICEKYFEIAKIRLDKYTYSFENKEM